MKTDNNITLRKITFNDLEWLRKLRNKNREFFFDNRMISKNQQEQWYKKLTYPFFVIEYKKVSVGTIGIKKIFNQWEIHNVIVDQKYRRKGIFTKVLKLLENKYGKPLVVNVRIDNTYAIAVYKKLGFRIIAYRMKKT